MSCSRVVPFTWILPLILLVLVIGTQPTHAQGWYNIVEISCVPEVFGGFFTFSLIPPVMTPPCDPIPCATPYVHCEVICDICAFAPCSAAVDCIIGQLLPCINGAGGGWSATQIEWNLILIEGPTPFAKCIWSDEMPFPMGTGLPLTPKCPVNNICNNIHGDEQAPHVNGLDFHVIDEGELPTLTPTNTVPPTPTETSTPMPTPTERPVWVNEIQVLCVGSVVGGGFTLSLILPVSAPPCDPIPCDPIGNPCPIDCDPCVMLGCPDAAVCIVDQIVTCVNVQIGPGFRALPIAPDIVRIEGPFPFDKCVWSHEMDGLPMGWGLPLVDGCDVNNLCNGILNDEGLPMASGIGLHILAEGPPATFTPTPTRSTGADETQWRVYR